MEQKRFIKESESLVAEQIFNKDLVLPSDSGDVIILPHKCPVTNELKTRLLEWSIKELCAVEPLEDIPAGEISAAIEDSVTPIMENVDVHVGNPAEGKVASAPKKINESVSIDIKNFLGDDKSAPAVPNNAVSINNDEIMMRTAISRYNEYIKDIHYIYTHYATHKKIDIPSLKELAGSMASFVRDNKRYIMRLAGSTNNRLKNFLVVHSMRSTVFSIIIALQLHIDMNAIRELTVAAILHEIGMLRLPPQLYIVNRKLLPQERAYMTAHTVYGYNIAKAQGLPAGVQIAILEHHEKVNGRGYPRKLISEAITMNAKIINVACSFEAITAPRTYKDPRTTSDAVLELCNNPNKQYDEKVLKALLESMSMFPIGSFVWLSDGRAAMVVDVNAEKPQSPVVEITDMATGEVTTEATAFSTVKIVRALTHAEEEDIKARLKKGTTHRRDEKGFEVIDESEFE